MISRIAWISTFFSSVVLILSQFKEGVTNRFPLMLVTFQNQALGSWKQLHPKNPDIPYNDLRIIFLQIRCIMISSFSDYSVSFSFTSCSKPNSVEICSMGGYIYSKMKAFFLVCLLLPCPRGWLILLSFCSTKPSCNFQLIFIFKDLWNSIISSIEFHDHFLSSDFIIPA